MPSASKLAGGVVINSMRSIFEAFIPASICTTASAGILEIFPLIITTTPSFPFNPIELLCRFTTTPGDFSNTSNAVPPADVILFFTLITIRSIFCSNIGLRATTVTADISLSSLLNFIVPVLITSPEPAIISLLKELL